MLSDIDVISTVSTVWQWQTSSQTWWSRGWWVIIQRIQHHVLQTLTIKWVLLSLLIIQNNNKFKLKEILIRVLRIFSWMRWSLIKLRISCKIAHGAQILNRLVLEAAGPLAMQGKMSKEIWPKDQLRIQIWIKQQFNRILRRSARSNQRKRKKPKRSNSNRAWWKIWNSKSIVCLVFLTSMRKLLSILIKMAIRSHRQLLKIKLVILRS